MKQWEDILKDRLQGYESALPEGGLARFRALRSGKQLPGGSRKLVPVLWVTGAVVAASLAAVLFLRQPAVPDEGIRIVQQESAPLALVDEGMEEDGPSQNPLPEASPVVRKATPVAPKPDQEEQIPQAESTEPVEESTEAAVVEEVVLAEPETEQLDSPAAPVSRPLVSSDYGTGPVRIKVGLAAGTVAGGGLLAAGLTALLGRNQTFPSYDSNTNGPIYGPMSSATHFFPFKAGLSVRIPIGESLSVTTGLQYGMYQSAITYLGSVNKTQTAHYLGVPVRLDWTFARNRWLDVYLGGGVMGDYCIAATLDREHINKDGFGFSLMGVGGIQLNITKQLGLYLEPEISWTIPSNNRVLDTYRTHFPVNFSLVTGLRFTIR